METSKAERPAADPAEEETKRFERLNEWGRRNSDCAVPGCTGRRRPYYVTCRDCRSREDELRRKIQSGN